MIGMSVWSILYASLGAASRQFLDGGEDLATIFSDLADKTGAYTSKALTASAFIAVLGGVAYLTYKYTAQHKPSTSHSIEISTSEGSADQPENSHPVCHTEEEERLIKVK